MLKNFKGFVLALAIGAAPLMMAPVQAHAQWGNFGQYNNGDQQRAYQAGYNNGVNDANKGKGMNLTTGNWKGVNLQAYQRGYETGYRQNRTSGNYGYGNNGYGNNGYGNNGYGYGRDRDHDRRYGNQGTYSYGQYNNNGDQQRAYQAGYNNGANDRSRNKSMNLRTGNWNGINRQAYERGYEAGYRSGGGRGGWFHR